MAQTYDKSKLAAAIHAVEDRILSGEEFRIRQLWILGNKVAGWREFDDKSPICKRSWDIVNSFRMRGELKSRRSGGSRLWTWVGPRGRDQ